MQAPTQAAGATVLPLQVDEGATAFSGDPLERQLQLRAAIARTRAERIAEQALGVHAYQRRGGDAAVALDEPHVLTPVDLVCEADGAELAIGRLEDGLDLARHQPL